MNAVNTTAAIAPANQATDLILDPVIDQDKEQVLEKKATFWVSLLKAVVNIGALAVSIFRK
jgi:hypothetical protein